MLRPNFNSLRDLHDCANDLLQLPATQQAFVQHRHVKWVEHVAEGSLRILDICGTTRDVLLLAREHLQDLQTAFRRRSVGERGLEIKIDAYNFSRKNIKKEMLKCLEALKQMKSKCILSPPTHIDHGLSVVVNVIQQVLVTAISIVESVLSYMSMSREKTSSNRSSFIWKIRRAKRVGSALEENVMEGVESLDTALGALYGNNSNLCEKTKAIAIQMETLKNTIEDVEVELEYMFRRFVQTRVSLLNILNS